MAYDKYEDWMTSDKFPFFSKLTDSDDHWIHGHDFYELFYVLEGSITHVLNGESETLNQGDLVFLNKRDVHFFLRTPGNECQHRDIILRNELFDCISDFLGSDFKTAYDNGKFPKKVSLPSEVMQQYEERIRGIMISIDTDSSFRTASVRSLCVSLFSNLFEKECITPTQNYPLWFEDLLGRFHMKQYLMIGMDKILEPYHFNKSYICRTFKKYMGCNMTDYLNDMRMKHAAHLLHNSKKKISTIANEIGFASISYFNQLFREKYGMSPHEFRKQYKDY